MLDSFKPFEHGIENAARRFPGLPKREVLLTRLYYHVFFKLNESANRSLKAYGLNSTTWIALILIYSSPDNAINPSDLSEFLASSRTNITRLADQLVKKNLVIRRACEKDRRRCFLSLTDAGIALVEKILPTQQERLKKHWEKFTEEEMKLFEALLRKLLKKLDR
jgi:MarR family transcriptional repressor of emrRAB